MSAAALERGVVVALALCAVLLAGEAARAQTIDQLAGQGSGSLDLERLRPAMGGAATGSVLDVEGGATGRAGAADASLWLNASFAPLTLVRADAAGGGGARAIPIVSERASAHLTGSLTLLDGFALGVEVPVVLWQNGPASVPGIAGKNEVAAFGLDDVRLVPKLGLIGGRGALVSLAADGASGGAHGPFALALALHTTLPTSVPRHRFIGDGLPTIEPELDVSSVLGPVTLAVDVGAKLRAASRFGGAVQSSELTARAGASLSFAQLVGVPVTLDATVNGGWLAFEPAPVDAPAALEGLLGAGLDVGPARIFAAAGTALVAAPGTPSLRALAGVRWSPPVDDAAPRASEPAPSPPVAPAVEAPSVVDRDLDGIRDLDDLCPALPEDPDGAMDKDGCPGSDEDGDGFLDGIDRCPSDAESKNNVDDGDGCPETGPVSWRRDTVPLDAQVSFVPATNKLDAKGMLALDAAVAYLRATKEPVFVDVEPAPAKDAADAKRQSKLSTLREAAIAKYLVKQGIAKKRVSTAAFAPGGAGTAKEHDGVIALRVAPMR